jgi:glycosyltransferase involved in cell wall biosynthesis
MYLEYLPRPTGSGAQLRFYSNARAYLDLGFTVEFVQVSAGTPDRQIPHGLASASVRHVPVTPANSEILGRLAYRIGVPNRYAFQYYFPAHRALRTAATSLAAQFPDALHHFEGESFASVIPTLALRRAIWSLHDLPSMTISAVVRIACDVETRKPTPAERRELRFASRAERHIAERTPLILALSDFDRRRLHEEWGIQPIETLPMSIPDEAPAAVLRASWCAAGKLTLLHLGRTAHLPTFRSLEFLLTKVFPLLPEEALAQVRLLIAGSHTGEDPRSTRVREWAARFPNQVSLLGFVDDLRPLYSQADLQVVGSTEASGLRTRILESFAFGLPVASTTIASRGILGLRPGENILIADTPESFAQTLVSCLSKPDQLATVAARARQTYDQVFSRGVVARSLATFLRKHLGL